MKEFLLSLLDWIYKKKCYFCGCSHESVKMCSGCADTLEHLPVKVNRIISGRNVYCCGVYSKNIQKLIRGLKYHRQPELAYYLAKFMYEYHRKITESSSFEIVPVPLHANRLKKRKYNHMNLVAEELCRLSGCILNTDLVKRVKDTAAQYKLSKKERKKNLANAFEVDKSKFNGGKILLIDDICTTGATFEEIIGEFKKHNINDIVCLAATTPFGE
ncbi:MAG: hypothetical protein LBK53_04435 [Heliobacteriaceae bacterium]|jgi:ComF family protein|nr:hypothetical protein [Heliobacteriaceae bacterium]